MNPFNYSIDDELLRYEEAANVKASNVPDTPNTADVVRYNAALGVEEVYTANPSGGHVKIAERSIDEVAKLKRYDAALREQNVTPSVEDYYAFGADDDLIAEAGLSPQAPMGGRTEPLTEFEQLYVERQGDELLQAGPDQPLFENAISEITKGLVRGGLVRPSQFLKENLNVYDPLVFQIVDPATGEFDPQLKIVSREEKAEIDQKIAEGEMPYAVDFERLVEADPASGMGAQVAGDLSQFVGAFAGVGKLFRLGGGIVGGATQGAAADFLAYRGDEGRLTDLLLEMGVPENKVTEFLKTDPNDPDYVGRFKTALEGGVIGAALEPVLIGMGKTFRAVKDGDVAPEAVRDAVARGKNALGEAFLKQVQGAEARIAERGDTTLFSNPVEPVVDQALAMAGRAAGEAKPSAAELRRQANIQRFGYDPNEAPADTSYRMEHQPTGPEGGEGIRLDDLTKNISGEQAGYPEDFYTPRGASLYAQGPSFPDDEYGMANQESYKIITSVRNNPDAEVTIYRAVPDEDAITTINPGDFVTLSRKYAELHGASGYGRSGDEAGKILEQKVKVRDIYWDGNDVNEFGYFPEDE